MEEPEKTETEDAGFDKKGNGWPVNGSVSKRWLIQRNNPLMKDGPYTSKWWIIFLSRPQTTKHSSQTSSTQNYNQSLLAHQQHSEGMLFQAEICQWPVKVIGARKVFQGKMPLIPIRLKRVNTYIRKKIHGWYTEPSGKRMSLIAKGNERCQRVTWWTTPRKGRGKGRDIINKDWSGRSRGDLIIIQKDIKQISEQKDYLLRNWGVCVDTIFWENRSKEDKEKQPMKNRVQSADWRKRRTVNTIRRWSERFNSDSGPARQNDWPMIKERIGRWTWRKAIIKRVRQKESMVEAGQSTIDDRSKSQF
jgi:hypothetical protein